MLGVIDAYCVDAFLGEFRCIACSDSLVSTFDLCVNSFCLPSRPSQATRRLSQPPLIRESSMGGGGMLTNVLRRMFCCCAGRSSSGNMRKTFDGVVLEPALEARLQFYAASIRNTRANRAPMRHMLFYGPPGTGKTMLVRSGVSFALCMATPKRGVPKSHAAQKSSLLPSRAQIGGGRGCSCLRHLGPSTVCFLARQSA